MDYHENVAIHKFKDALGGMLQIERKARNLAIDELAYKCNISIQYMGDIINGNANPSLAILLKISFGLEIPLSVLIERSESIMEGGG